MRNIAIVLAGGTGKRMNSNLPKQYMELNGKPILYYSLKTFEESFIDEIILVCKAGDEEYCRTEIVEKYGISKVNYIVAGGKERYNSVYNGLECIETMNSFEGNDYVYIHDGARPFISEDVLERISEGLMQHNACIAGVPVKDTIKVVDDDNKVVSTPARESLYQIQTPQAFELKLVKDAYAKLNELEKLGKNDLKITDDAMVVENFSNENVYIIYGDYSNIKVTTPEDIVLGNIILNKK